jgi:hypothetical protein
MMMMKLEEARKQQIHSLPIISAAAEALSDELDEGESLLLLVINGLVLLISRHVY